MIKKYRIFVFVTTLLFFSCKSNVDNRVASIEWIGIDKTVELTIGQTFELKARAYPEYASQQFEWSSSDSSVAEIDSNGKVFVKAVGEAKIRVASKSNSDMYNECTIYCYARINLSQDKTYHLSDFLSEELKEKIKDINTYWVENNGQADEGFFDVSSDGELTIKEGVTGRTWFNLYADTGEQLVNFAIDVGYYISSLKFRQHEYRYLIPGDTTQLEYTVIPENAENVSELIWESSDTSKATVDKNGLITAKDNTGIVNIKIYTKERDIFDTCTVYIENKEKLVPPDEINLSGEEIILYIGGKEKLEARVSPDNTYDGLVWTSDNSSVAEVDEDTGEITAMRKGETIITAASMLDYKVSKSCIVKVVDHPSGYFNINGNASFILGTYQQKKYWTAGGTIEYTTNINADDVVWETWTGSQNILSGESTVNGKKEYNIYLRGINNTRITGDIDRNWIISPTSSADSSKLQVSLNGDIRTLLDYRKVNSLKPEEKCFAYMFYDCDYLVSIGQLSLLNLSNSCYAYMFAECDKLNNSNNNVLLPSKNLAPHCYEGMFKNCKSFDTFSSNFLPAAKMAEGCYKEMFYGTKISNAEKLSSLLLAESCYESMFENCTITSLPNDLLPATKLAKACYKNMFKNNKSLTLTSNAFALNYASSMVESCFEGMFKGCTSISSIPSGFIKTSYLAKSCFCEMFSGTKVSSIDSNMFAFNGVNDRYILDNSSKGTEFSKMFSDCDNLTTISADFLKKVNELSFGCYSYMFQNCKNLVSVDADLLSNNYALQQECYSYMFKGCSKLEDLPALPKTPLAVGCYMGMFSDCTSIKKIPFLPATNLLLHCYDEMFLGTGIKLVTQKTDPVNQFNNSFSISSDINNYAKNFLIDGEFSFNPGIIYYTTLDVVKKN